MNYLFRKQIDSIKLKGIGLPIPATLEVRQINLIPGRLADMHWRVILPPEDEKNEIEISSGVLPIPVPAEMLMGIEQYLESKLPEFKAALEGKEEQQ